MNPETCFQMLLRSIDAKMDKMVELLVRLVGMNQSSNTTPQLYTHIQPNYLPYPPNFMHQNFPSND